MKLSIPSPILALQTLLKTEQLFLVGGFVRDASLGKLTTDFDVCSPLLPHEVVSRLGNQAKAVIVSQKMGTVQIALQGAIIEHTTFRKDEYLPNGSHEPIDCQFVGSMQQDALRRDFTINALYAAIPSGEVVDLFDGLSHIKRKQVVSVQNPNKTFLDDPLRILRMIRFAATLGFSIEENTWKGAETNLFRLPKLTKTRIWQEFEKAQAHGTEVYQTFVNLFAQLGADKVLFGVIAKLNLQTTPKDLLLAHTVLQIFALQQTARLTDQKLFDALPKQFKIAIPALVQFLSSLDAYELLDACGKYAEFALSLLACEQPVLAKNLKLQYQKAKQNGLFDGTRSFAIDGNTLKKHFPCLESKKYAIILKELRKKVFAQILPNDEVILLEEIKKLC